MKPEEQRLIDYLRQHCGIGEWVAIEFTRGDVIRVGIADHGTHAPGGTWKTFGLGSSILEAAQGAVATLSQGEKR